MEINSGFKGLIMRIIRSTQIHSVRKLRSFFQCVLLVFALKNNCFIRFKRRISVRQICTVWTTNHLWHVITVLSNSLRMQVTCSMEAVI